MITVGNFTNGFVVTYKNDSIPGYSSTLNMIFICNTSATGASSSFFTSESSGVVVTFVNRSYLWSYYTNITVQSQIGKENLLYNTNRLLNKSFPASVIFLYLQIRAIAFILPNRIYDMLFWQEII